MPKTIDKSHMDVFINGVKVSEGKKEESENYNAQWWKEDDDEALAAGIIQTLKYLEKPQAARIENLVHFTRLYGSRSAYSLSGHVFPRAPKASASPAEGRVSFNVCQSVVDTLTSRAAKNKVIPVFITNGGDWSVQQKAQDLSKYVEGCFHSVGAHRKLALQFRDGEIWDVGILHPYAEGKRARVERVLPHEIIVDEVEAMVTDPRTMFRVKIANRSRVLAKWGVDKENRAKIESASPTIFTELGGEGTSADLVTLIEAWHLPSEDEPEEKTTDGRHVLCVGDKTLVTGSYLKDYFPFVFFLSSPSLLGFWGQGAVERLQNIQAEINRLSILDQRSRRMMASFKVLLENSSKVVSQHLNNDVGTLIRYTGVPPQYVTPPPIDASNGERIRELISHAYQQEGVSQLTASGVKPLGLNSGKALRTYGEKENDRQLFIEQQLESAALELARQLIEVGKDVYKKHKSHKVLFPSTTFVEEIDWKDVKLERDQYVMKAFPTSSLANDTAGRLQDVQELAQAGMISPRTARKLLRMPDIEMADTLANAQEDLLHKVFEDMLKHGLDEDFKYRGPEPEWDLQLGMQLALQYLAYAEFHNAPEKILALVRNFKKQISDLMAKSLEPNPLDSAVPTPTSPAPAGIVPAVPPANPAATPQSELIPNIRRAA